MWRNTWRSHRTSMLHSKVPLICLDFIWFFSLPDSPGEVSECSNSLRTHLEVWQPVSAWLVLWLCKSLEFVEPNIKLILPPLYLRSVSYVPFWNQQPKFAPALTFVFLALTAGAGQNIQPSSSWTSRISSFPHSLSSYFENHDWNDVNQKRFSNLRFQH